MSLTLKIWKSGHRTFDHRAETIKIKHERTSFANELFSPSWRSYALNQGLLASALIRIRRHSLTMLTRFWPFLTTYLLTPDWHLWRNSFTVMRKNMYTVDISSTTYLPRLANVVCERPLQMRQYAAFVENWHNHFTVFLKLVENFLTI